MTKALLCLKLGCTYNCEIFIFNWKGSLMIVLTDSLTLLTELNCCFNSNYMSLWMLHFYNITTFKLSVVAESPRAAFMAQARRATMDIRKTENRLNICTYVNQVGNDSCCKGEPGWRLNILPRLSSHGSYCTYMHAARLAATQ